MARNYFGARPWGGGSFFAAGSGDDGNYPYGLPEDGGGVSTVLGGQGVAGSDPPPAGNGARQVGGSGVSSSSSSSKSVTTTASPYAQFKGNNYADLEAFLRERMNDVKPETEAERERRERREKHIGFLARLADGLGAFHTAFSHARGVKPMEMPHMSAKARERFEKAKAERDKDIDRWVNYAVTLGKIKDSDRDFNFRVTQAEQQQSNWQQQFDAGRKDRADDVAFRDKKFDTDNEHWQKGFEENQRQFNVTSAENARHNKASESLQGASIAEQRRHNRASEGLERQRIAASNDGKYTEFMLNDGSMIRVPNQRLNLQNISWVAKQAGIPTTKNEYKGGSIFPTAVARTADELMVDIGQNLGDAKVQAALRSLGGQPAKGKGYGNGGGNGRGRGY